MQFKLYTHFEFNMATDESILFEDTSSLLIGTIPKSAHGMNVQQLDNCLCFEGLCSVLFPVFSSLIYYSTNCSTPHLFGAVHLKFARLL